MKKQSKYNEGKSYVEKLKVKYLVSRLDDKPMVLFHRSQEGGNVCCRPYCKHHGAY